MLLAFDTSSAACTAALFNELGECIARADELIGRGHAERLVPMIADLLGGRACEQILVGVGPGSFTGIRVAIAAAHGLAIGWDAELCGMSSLALLAAGVESGHDIAASVTGGHGELFIQEFDGTTFEQASDLQSAAPRDAARTTRAALVVGSGAKALVQERGSGEAVELWPSAANALKLPLALRSLPPKPIYARAPDARVRVAA